MKRRTVLITITITITSMVLLALIPHAVIAAAPAVVSAEMPVTAEEMLQYAGRYQLAPRAILNIRAGTDNLLAQITGQPEAPVYMRKRDEFFYKAVEASLHFSRNDAGVVMALALHQDGRVIPAARIGDALSPASMPEPTPKHVAITLPLEVLQQYTGSYTLAPNLVLAISETNGHLFAQATNQARARIFPQARDEFFYKVVDAQLSFQRDAAGKVTGLVLHQNGRELSGPRE